MLGRLPRRDPEAALELLVGDIAGIRTEGVDLRDVPRDEDLEAPHVYQVESVGDDAGQKAAVLLIASQLGPAVVLILGPDALSINSLSATRIYGAQLHMEKGDSYLMPGHVDAVALFFKQKTRAIHSDRKRIWSAAFTGAACVSNLNHDSLTS